jgi:hypothetical protein
MDSYSDNETGIEGIRYHKSNDFRIVKGIAHFTGEPLNREPLNL